MNCQRAADRKVYCMIDFIDSIFLTISIVFVDQLSQRLLVANGVFLVLSSHSNVECNAREDDGEE
jgi:hypothetical protein